MTILLRDYDLNARFSMAYQKCHSEFHPNTQGGDGYASKTSPPMLKITSVQVFSPNSHTVISEQLDQHYQPELPGGCPLGGTDLGFRAQCKSRHKNV
jgi:hypothetical protein